MTVMAGMPEASIDAIVTDPPYGLEFMGKEWDRLWDGRRADTFKHGEMAAIRNKPTYAAGPQAQQFHEQWATAALRVAKPGAYLLAFGGTRTVHRMTVALEDAGWIIRDMLVWAYASGFPKSRALLKPAWEPIVMARKPGPLRDLDIDGCRIVSGPTTIMDAWEDDANLCASCAADAANRERPGTSATRASTTPRRVEQLPSDWATSGDTDRRATGCSGGTRTGRTGTSLSTDTSGNRRTDPSRPDTSSTTSTETEPTTGSRTCSSCGASSMDTTITGTTGSTPNGRRQPTTSDAIVGRWPSNVILSSPIFDGDTEGVVGGGSSDSSGFYDNRVRGPRLGAASIPLDNGPQYGDTGTYSRFFLIPKASRSDREPVMPGMLEERERHASDLLSSPLKMQPDGQLHPKAERARRANVHPTVKPVELMRHLVRLVTPAGGVVLDPFLGSGSTALAAEQEGREWVGIEREEEYVRIAEARLAGNQRGLGLVG